MGIRKILVIMVLAAVLYTGPVFAQDQKFDFGKFSFSLSPKILKDGSITDFGIGYRYAERISGNLRLRFVNEVKNEQFESIEDSLNAVNGTNIQVFLLPFEYFLVRRPQMEFHLGAGLYYENEALKEKGFFNLPSLEPDHERVNSFTNEFSLNVAGPDIDAGFSFQAKHVNLTFHGGIVPVFYLGSKQKMGIVPLLGSDYADYTQQTAGSPYFYLDLGLILFKYVSLAFLYDFSRLDYKVIDFDSSLNWYNPEQTVFSQSLKLEVSVLIPLGGAVYTQVGYGHTFDSLTQDSNPAVQSNKQYLILCAKTVR
jgi:hypothetical protein